MEQKDALFSARHSCAHMVAAAVRELYPDAKFGVGPVIEHGFYYDIKFPENISDAALKKIEKQAKRLLKRNIDFVKTTMPIDDAIAFFAEKNQTYKVSLLTDLKERGTTKMTAEELQDLGASVEDVSIYTSGNFIDLCRGPHVANTKEINPEGLMLYRLAGAYWRGDEKNDQLQRIYGFYFATKEELDAHVHMLEEAKKRDHRKLGKELDLFVFSDLVGSGLPLWTPRGTVLRDVLDNYVWNLRKERGYERVSIPHITKKDLYETSGHWAKFSEELFKINTREGHVFAMKPMNCPHHTQIYAHTPRSYRDLPQRYAETTRVYRDEQTGELHGLSRVRAITQDDAHVFCREIQVKEEMLKIWEIIETFYKSVGFEELSVRLSLHDPDNFEAYLGTPEMWEKAEQTIRTIAQDRGVTFREEKGEAAFYGPKVDFTAKDSIGRLWQVATIQLDINMPERFDLFCTNEQGEKERIVMIHAAIMGSIERFLSVLIEHHAGNFPVWLAPVQVGLVPVSQKHLEGAEALATELRAQGVRVYVERADETVGNKVRKTVAQKIPYILVIGDRELEQNEFSVRLRDQSGETIAMKKEDFIAKITQEMLP